MSELPYHLRALQGDGEQHGISFNDDIIGDLWKCSATAYAERITSGKNDDQFISYRHIEFINDVVQPKILEGNAKIIIDAPPRHGKTFFLTKLLPVWFLDMFPGNNVILTSYNEKLARGNGRYVRDKVKECELVDAKLRADVASNTEWMTESGSEFLSTGINGTLTGKGFHLGSIDDPVKNWREATNQRLLVEQREWYSSTFNTRGEPGASQIIVATRWSTEDLSGWLLRTNPDEWIHIKLPAIAESDDQMGRREGEALCPERYPIEQLEMMREATQDRIWNALFQCDPEPDKGDIFDRDTLDRQTWIEGQLPVFDEIYQSWDLSFGSTNDSASYVVGQVWGRVTTKDPLTGSKKNNLYLLYQVRERMTFPTMIQRLLQISKMYPQGRIFIEEKANGKAMIQTIKVAVADVAKRIVTVNPAKWGDKVSRARAAELYLSAGNVWIPPDSKANWRSDFVKEMSQFPNYPTNDQVDTFSQAVLVMEPSISENKRSVWDAFKRQ